MLEWLDPVRAHEIRRVSSERDGRKPASQLGDGDFAARFERGGGGQRFDRAEHRQDAQQDAFRERIVAIVNRPQPRRGTIRVRSTV
ncbi:MAG: hypothetical protein U1E25_07385 [Methylocystis sp.]